MHGNYQLYTSIILTRTLNRMTKLRITSVGNTNISEAKYLRRAWIKPWFQGHTSNLYTTFWYTSTYHCLCVLPNLGREYVVTHRVRRWDGIIRSILGGMEVSVRLDLLPNHVCLTSLSARFPCTMVTGMLCVENNALLLTVPIRCKP